MAKTKNIDRLSNLPDHLIHHIYSFIDCEEIDKMIFVSKKLHLLCSTNPACVFAIYLHHPSSASKFHKFLKKQLSGTNHQYTPLLRLSLSWHKTHQRMSLHHDQSIPKGLDLPKLETLRLKFHGLELLYFSDFGSLISSTFPSFKKLVLHFDDCGFNEPTINITNTSLETLEVSGVESSSLKTFVLKIDCPSLKHLSIKNVKFEHASCKIIVNGKQLRTLFVDQAEFLNPSRQRHSFTIHAPNLRSFHWRGSPTGQYRSIQESFISLEDAVLEVTSKNHKHYNNFVEKVLQSIQHAVHLDVRLPGFNQSEFLVDPRYISYCRCNQCQQSESLLALDSCYAF